MAGLQVLLCSRCKAAYPPHKRQKTNGNNSKIFKCIHLQTSEENIEPVLSSSSLIQRNENDHNSAKGGDAAQNPTGSNQGEVPDAASNDSGGVQGGTVKVKEEEEEEEEMMLQDNNASNDAAAVPQDEHSDNGVVKQETDIFSEIPDPGGDVAQNPTGSNQGEVPDAASNDSGGVQGGTVKVKEEEEEMMLQDNNASNDAAAVPQDDHSNNGVVKQETDIFFEIPDPGDPSTMVPMAFCCARCKCSEERKEKYGKDKLAVQGEGEYAYHHRFCCHKIWVEEVSEGWLPPYDKAEEQLLLEANDGDVDSPSPKRISLREFQQSGRVCQNFMRRDTTARGLDQDVCGVSNVWSNETYVANNKRFQEIREQRKDDRKPAVVLDMFGGIGGGLVALKRQGIAMQKAIHVEHDMIATHVVQSQHDNQYNEQLSDDGIEHVYYSKFELIEKDLDDFMEKHGPIDIMIGGPPCSDYSGLNAYARGAQGQQGQYLIRFAELIKLIQEHAQQNGHPLFFLMENVVFRQGSRFEDLMDLEELTGVPPTIWDAQYLSPCRRDRSYWMNFPLPSEAQELGYEEARRITPDSCLEEGWLLPEMFLHNEDLPSEDELYLIKTNTFLASKGRIDAAAMLKLKEEGDSLVEGSFSALERERMLGFKDGYVYEPVKQLFETLLSDAYSKIDSRRGWREALDSKYYKFSGEPVQYEPDVANFRICIKMSPPPKNEQDRREFFDVEQYSKHLLGLGFSVPVVEMLLTNLKHVFASREYEGYDYDFLWE